MYTEITDVSKGFEELIDNIVQINTSARGQKSFFYDSDCADRLEIICQNAKAITSLCKLDFQFFNSAKIICRAMFEASVRVGWILNTDSKLEKENRWLAFVKNASKSIGERQKEILLIEPETSFRQDELAEIENIINVVSENINSQNPRIKLLNGIPNFKQMLEESDAGFMYLLYRELSDETHASHLISGLYSTEYGLNEGGKVVQWWHVYSLMWFSLLFGPVSYLREKLNDEDILHSESQLLQLHIKSVRELADKLLKA